MQKKQLHLVVAQNIRKRRQNLGLSQEGLAEQCGLHRTYIGAIERGERNITVNTLACLAGSLDCTVIDLLVSLDENTEPTL
jgi:transcriptional regulator with XRE-family HTH domain